jgi:hypothetical protein
MSFFDDLAGNGDSSTQQYLQQALKQYQNIQTPTIASEQVNNLPQETIQGTVNPEQIKAVDQAPSAYNDISLDPASRQAQMNALQSYQDIANSGGLDAESKLALQQVINSTQQQSQGAQGAIQQQAQAMGQGGGDFALTQRAIAAQGASNNASTQGMQAAAQAEANRETALNNMANIGGTINSQDYGQAAQKAGAQNTINATNQGFQNNANVGNVANNMAAQGSNVANAQGVNAANTTAKQNQVYYNAGLPQQQFNNELQKAGGVAGVSQQQSNAAQQSTAGNQAGLGKLLGAAGQGVAAYYGAGGGAAGASKALSGTTAVNSGVGSAPTGANANKSQYGLAGGGTVPCYAEGGMPHDHSICMTVGGHVPGEAAVAGDSVANDTVDAKLSPGELVIPRSVPKDGPHMEQFARNAPIGGTNKKVDLTTFTHGYKKGR